MRVGITGVFRTSRENDKSKVKGVCAWVTHTSSTRVVRGKYGVDVKSLIDLELVKKILRREVMDRARRIRS